jgi:beta-lactamase regulating signal transducer with metallopeptidase domain
MNALGIALVWCVIQVSILAGVVVIVYTVTRRSGPPARALAAFAGLLLIVVLSALAFSPWPRWQSRTEFARANNAQTGQTGADSLAGETASVKREAEDEAVAGNTDTMHGQSQTGAEFSSPTAVFFETLVSELQRVPAPVENETWGWPAYVAVLFLIGAGAGLVRLAAGLAVVRLYRLRARRIADASLCETVDVLLAEFQVPRRIVLCESELLTTPATIGWRRPLIILPTDWKRWTEEERRAVLAHEIAHIVRHDFATLIAAQVAVVLHFYHPLVHWLAARLRLEQELAADAAAARLAGGQRTYLTTLAGMALRQSDRPLAWPARTFLPTRGTFMRRIEMLRDESSVSRNLSPGLRAVLIAALLTAGLGVAGLRGNPGDREVAAGQAEPTATAAKQTSGSKDPAAAESGKSNSSETKATYGTSGSSKSSGSGTSSSGGNSGTSGGSSGRSGGSSSSGSVSADGQSGTSSTAIEPFSLAYVPRDAVAIAAVRPAALLSRPALAPIKNALLQQRELQQSLGVAPDRIDQVIGVFVMDLPANRPGPGEPVPAGAIVHLAEGTDAAAMVKALQPNPEEQEFGGRKYVRGRSGTGSVCLLADARTVVICAREEHMRRLIVAGAAGAAKAKWIETWKGGAHADAAVLVNMAPIAEMLSTVVFASNPQTAMEIKLGAFAPLWQGTTTGLLTAHFGGNLKLGLLLNTKNHEYTQQVKATLEAAITLGQNSLSQTRSMISRQPGNDAAFFLGLIDTVDSLIDSIKFEPSDGNYKVVASASLDVDDAPKIFAMLLPAIANAKQAAARTQSMNNLKQLGLAMHNYAAEKNGSFPPAVLYGPDGKTPYSWRVALLPYLDQAQLYQQYKFNEPWDSPDNKLVLAKMPALFRDPADPADSTYSSYFAITGPSTIFFGKEGAKIAQITDGTSNTLMFVEARRDIPWTKPEDIPYAADVAAGDAPTRNVSRYVTDAPLPKLGGHYPDIFMAANCDGSVRAVSQKIDPAQLRYLLTRDGGEAIDWDRVNVTHP